MNFNPKQLEAMAEVAKDFRNGIEVETTNLHGGSTIVMRGVPRARSEKREILVSATGQTTDLGLMGR